MIAAMIIKGHRLEGAAFKAAAYSGDEITPTLIVLHETAGRLEKGNTVSWFQSRSSKVSAHFVIERDGSIVQMVPCNRKAFHAGVSGWQGRKFCNSFSIGIELVGPGKLDENGRAWFGEVFPDAKEAASEAHGRGKWLCFTPAQIESCRALCVAIMGAYPDCNDIATHWEVSPGRKVDPCPLFPLDELRASLMAPEVEDEVPLPKPVVSKGQAAAGAAAAGGTTVAAVDPSWWMFWKWPWSDWVSHLGCSTGIECASAIGSYSTQPVAMVSIGMIVAAIWMAKGAKA